MTVVGEGLARKTVSVPFSSALEGPALNRTCDGAVIAAYPVKPAPPVASNGKDGTASQISA